MKVFDFTKSPSCPERIAWLKENHKKPITEKEFLEAWQHLRQFSKAKQNSHANSPSAARQHYKRLKNNFGFFPIK